MDITTPFEVTQLTDCPMVLFTFYPEFRLRHHLGDLVQQMTEAIVAAPGPVYSVLDIRQIRLDWSDLLLALADIRDLRKNAAHPANNLGVLIITNSEVLKLGAKALGQQQYGGSAVGLFDSLDAALEYARSQ